MNRRPMLILADDLTGACDTAGAVAAQQGRVRVVLRGAAPAGPGPVTAVDLDTRALPAAAAVQRTIVAVSSAPGDVYLKIDSTLRGHVHATVTAAAGAFHANHGTSRVVVCPAFPARGRQVRGGRVVVEGSALASTVLAELAAIPGIETPDAASDSDLAAVAASSRGEPTLWVGSAGLAAHVCGSPVPGARRSPPRRRDPADEVCVVVGTTDPATLEGVAALDGPAIGGVRVLAGDPRRAAFAAAAIKAAANAAALVLTGGYTARRVLDGLGVTALDVHGELEPGIPWATVVGAPTVVVTKAGGFGDAGTLRRLVDRLRGR